MKLAMSNIAWMPEQRLVAYKYLGACSFQGLEIAPGLFFHAAEDAFVPDEKSSGTALAEIEAEGLQCVSMQSLLFGVSGAALFEGREALVRFEVGMHRAIGLAGRFSIPNLVFGSPRQRVVPEGMSMNEALLHAVSVFRRLGDSAAAAGTGIAVEFNPAAYGANFLTDVDQTMDFVRRVDHPAIGLCLDIGAMHMNGHFDRIEEVVKDASSHIFHTHMSEPDLAPAPASVEQAKRVLSALSGIGYRRWVSIEMKSVDEGGLILIEKSIQHLAQANRIDEATGHSRCPI